MAKTNEAQAEYWNSANGLKWVQFQEELDATMAAMLDLVLDAAALQPGEDVLDIGCGAGAGCLRAAEQVAPAKVLGVDISEPLLAKADERVAEAALPNVSFLCADAQIHPFEEARYNALVSRFGVMFFEDPAAAFANLRRATRPGGRMVFVAWSNLESNPWFLIPQKAAEARLAPLPPADNWAPGPLAFQDQDFVLGLLEKAGWAGRGAQEVEAMLTPPGGIEDAARLSVRLGPAARILRAHEGTDADAAAIAEAVAKELAPYERSGRIEVPARVHLVTASV